jgi:hypothetical protein
MAEQTLSTIEYFTAEELEEIKKNGNFIIDQVFDESQVSDEIKEIYNKTKLQYAKTCSNDYCKKYKDAIAMLTKDKIEPFYFEDAGKYITKKHAVLGDLEYFVLPADVYLYKGSKWFYDTMPKKHFWVGDKAIALQFANYNDGGLNVYRSKKDLELLVLNKTNLFKIYNGIDDPGIRKFMENVYGCGKTVIEQAEYMRKRKAHAFDKIPLVNKNKTLREKVQRLQYIRTDWPTNAIHTHIYEKFNFQGTFLPYFISPFISSYGLEEININIANQDIDIYIDTENPFYWKNWDLLLPDFNKFQLNEKYNNKEFRALTWYNNKDNTNIGAHKGVRILSLNVMNFNSANVLDSPEDVLNMTLALIKKTKPNIIVLEEFESDFFNKIPCVSKFKTLNGGGTTSLAVFTDQHAKIRPIEYYGTTFRNSLEIKYRNLKIIATHLEIGRRYLKGSGDFLDLGSFNEVYNNNYNMREKQLKMLLDKNPDIIIGDFNFNPDDREIKILTDADYNYNSEPVTSIYESKVDFVFSKPYITGKESVLEYYRSDHKPIIFDIDTVNWSKRRRVSGGEPNSISVWVVILIVIIIASILILIFIFHKHKYINIHNLPDGHTYQNKEQRI